MLGGGPVGTGLTVLAQAASEETTVDPTLVGLAITVVAVAVGAVSAWVVWTRAKRKRSLPEVARRAGLSYSDADPFDCDRVAFPLFRAGDVRTVEHVMWNPDTGARAFDYAYAVERRREDGTVQRTWQTFTCATIRHDGRWPQLRLLRERIFDRALQRLGLPDVDLESEAFNRTFVVQCEDPRFATDLLDPRMMEFLLGTEGRVTVETKGRELLVTSRRVDPRLFPALLGIAEGIVARVPRVVWDVYGRFPAGGDASVVDTWLAAERDARAAEDGPVGGGSFWAPGLSTGGPLPSPSQGVGSVWRGTWEAERLDARRRATEPEDKAEFDLDGNPITPPVEDPWGDGRPAPTGEFDLDGNPIAPREQDPWGDGGTVG